MASPQFGSGLQLSNAKVTWDKTAELKIAKRHFMAKPAYMPYKLYAGGPLPKLKESLNKRARLDREQSNTLEDAYERGVGGAVAKRSRKMLKQSFSRRERLQGRTKEVAREQRWARSRQAKQMKHHGKQKLHSAAKKGSSHSNAGHS